MRFIVSFKEAEDLLLKIYKERYKGYNICFSLEKEVQSSPDGFGFYDEYPVLKGDILITKKRMILGKEREFYEYSSIEHKELYSELVNQLNNNLSSENLQVDYFTLENDSIVVRLKDKINPKKKEKTLIGGNKNENNDEC